MATIAEQNRLFTLTSNVFVDLRVMPVTEHKDDPVFVRSFGRPETVCKKDFVANKTVRVRFARPSWVLYDKQ